MKYFDISTLSDAPVTSNQRVHTEAMSVFSCKKSEHRDTFLYDTVNLILNELCFWTLSIVWCLKNKQN